MKLPRNAETKAAFLDLLLSQDNYQMKLSEVHQRLAEFFNLTGQQLAYSITEWTLHGTRHRSHWKNRVRSAKARLIKDGMLCPYEEVEHGDCRLTGKGASVARDAADISEPRKAARVLSSTYRTLRDSALVRRIKALHEFRCQLCGNTILLQHERLYAETHHIRPLGSPHDGPDVAENILCLCPNHHVQLDHFAIQLSKSDLRICDGHMLGKEHIDYHNTQFRRIWEGHE